MPATRPLIGLTASLERMQEGPWDARQAAVPEPYLLAVAGAGGAAVLLPPQPFDDALVQRVLDGVDGLLLTGGADVDPALYGQAAHGATSAPRPDRDDWEAALTRAAVARGVPVLAICRGVQLLDVALGGTLQQHVPEVTAADHGNVPGAFAATEVAVVGGVRLPAAVGPVGTRLPVQCAHHQVIDRVADGLVVTARSADGLIEAVEAADGAFVVGVQWHPEQDAVDGGLFAALVAAARERAVAPSIV